MSFVFAGAILKCFGATDIELEGSPEHPVQEAPGPSPTSGPPSVQEAPGPSQILGPPSDVEASSAYLHGQQLIVAKPVDPADWPSVVSHFFRTDAVGRGPFQISPDCSFPKKEDGRIITIFKELWGWGTEKLDLAYLLKKKSLLLLL